MPAKPSASPDAGIATLYRDHHAWLHGWLRLKLGDAHRAADLAQDTFVRLLSANPSGTLHPSGTPNPSDAQSPSDTPHAPNASHPPDTALREPRAYLRTIANRLLVDHWRRLDIERSYLAVLQTYPQQHWPSEESRLLILESLEQVAQMLGRLKPEVRDVFLLAQMDGYTCPQIARQVGKSVATVERYLAQALGHCYRLVYES
ncbi:Probable RNA polymerase sigma factor fecI [Achromobacter sp. 2789STDY5608615]|uniref:sigma factor-like helix-turn-helix DNA-binding protein n=1 Tax=Achromobacter sp. 2789STDY5608615 TaxID=1806492 RepID=UPI0006C603F5|nr:sigma factor-like helix-turn-helix DNA-binding protein [Achromobacter sp. 2789STDY5608615]CUJ96907.1 Probable RNA polymerase sigma factor fecI [Achromobacter sp. 2789STDY5608615]